MLRQLAVLLAVVVGGPSFATVTVTAPPAALSEVPTGQRSIQKVTLANDVASYTLTYDRIDPPGFQQTPEATITSHWWAWEIGYITIGITSPSQSNWYFQGFIKWHFDDLSLHDRPAVMRVVRDGGTDGVVEFAWDTPTVAATLRFVLPDGGDKLLMFGDWDPKQPIQSNWLELMSYASGFSEPRHRAVTTATRTAEPPEKLTLDLATERWALFEDTTAGHPADGSAGLLIGTPEAFSDITIPVGTYGTNTRLDLRPEARSFALGLYSYPSAPEYEVTRAYFREAADGEAERLAQDAAHGLAEPLAPWSLHPARMAWLVDRATRSTQRPAEIWQPDPAPLEFPWAARLAGGPIKTVLFTARWRAWETMELARRLDLQVDHLYFDSTTALADLDRWPYRAATGITTLGPGTASLLATNLCQAPGTELYLCAAVQGAAMPAPARSALLDQIRAGAGLLLVGNPGDVATWPEELFTSPLPDVTAATLAGFDWESLPGLEPGGRGRAGDQPPLTVYQLGAGRVVAVRMQLNTYSALVPRNEATDGQAAALDRSLALAARAALAATGRATPGLRLVPDAAAARVTVHTPTAGQLDLRVQDDLGRTVATVPAQAVSDGQTLDLPALPAGRGVWLDAVLRDAEGRAVALASQHQPAGEAAAGIARLELPGAVLPEGTLTPLAPLPDEGRLAAVAHLAAVPPAGAIVHWEVRDAFDRLLASAETPAAGTSVEVGLPLAAPVTPAHRLLASLRAGGSELAFEQLRFTRPMAPEYDDFVPLMWSYAGGDPVLRRTDRACFDWGAGMMDLCNIIGLPADRATREFALAADSGLRLVPYVTRLYSLGADRDHVRQPCLHDTAYLDKTRASVRTLAQQAAPWSPPAFTLGDENMLLRTGEGCFAPATLAAWGDWLQGQYGDLGALNRSWGATLTGFGTPPAPPLLQETPQQTAGFAPWIDHKRFMDVAFAEAHNDLARVIREEFPGARVGWDGFLGDSWRSGYDFDLLSEELDLNQCYTVNWLQGEFMRSFKRPGALSGKWGNHTADNEAGFTAWPWSCLFDGDNSVWWWTSWGVDYIPFNPDLSQSNFGKWFFKSAREVAAGPGKLLLHANRVDSPIVVRYPRPDLFAATVADALVKDQPAGTLPAGAVVPGTSDFWRQHEGLLRGLKDGGYQYRHLSSRTFGADLATSGAKLVCLTQALMLSDDDVAALRAFVEAGGTLLLDGRSGFLDGRGALRARRALDELLGVRSRPGTAGMVQPGAAAEATFTGQLAGQPLPEGPVNVMVLEPDLELAGATALGQAGEAPVMIVNTVGSGRTVLLNLALGEVVSERVKPGVQPLASLVTAVTRAAGVEPPLRLTPTDPAQGAQLAGGEARPLAIELTEWHDGPARYLSVQQDLRKPTLVDQPVTVRLPEPAIVYDVRAGQRVGTGPVSEWQTTLSRGNPHLYALLPAPLAGPVEVTSPPTTARGGTVRVPVRLTAEGGAAPAGFQVVRLDVFAPDTTGTDAPHRLYSQNIACTNGVGEATFPTALNDPAGTWRLLAHDVATGTRGEGQLTLN